MIENLKQYLKFVPYVTIVGLVIALSVTQCSKQKLKLESNDKIFEAVIKTDKARIKALETTSKALKLKIKEDSIKSKASQIAYSKEIKKLKVKLAYARTQVKPLIDSIPELDRFVDLQDSTINLQDGRIDTLEYEKAEMWAKFNDLLSSAEEKNKVQIELTSHYVELNQQLSKQVRKERNKKTGLKIVSGVLATGILYMAIKE